MPVYRLRCSYAFTDGRHGTAFDEHEIAAATDEEAKSKAQAARDTPPKMRLASAVLIKLDGHPIWSLQPMADARYPFARDGVEPFEG